MASVERASRSTLLLCASVACLTTVSADAASNTFVWLSDSHIDRYYGEHDTTMAKMRTLVMSSEQTRSALETSRHTSSQDAQIYSALQ